MSHWNNPDAIQPPGYPAPGIYYPPAPSGMRSGHALGHPVISIFLILLLLVICPFGCSRSKSVATVDSQAEPFDAANEAENDAGNETNPEDKPGDKPEAVTDPDSGLEQSDESAPIDAAAAPEADSRDESDAAGPTSLETPSTSHSTDSEMIDSGADVDVSSAPVSESPPPDPTVARMILLAGSGPILIDFQLWYDSVPAATAWTESNQKLVNLADSNEDGETTWTELLDNRLLLNLAFGNGALQDADQFESVAMSYDSNGNRNVEPAELIRFLSRNRRGVGSFSFESQPFDPYRQIANSPLRRFLDTNGDGILSTEDKQRAAQRLRTLDADVDGRLWPGDFRQEIEQPASMQSMRYNNRNRGPSPVRLLHDGLEWSYLRNDLEETYAFGSAVTRGDLEERGDLFDALDTNDSGDLQTFEIEGLLTLTPDVNIQVDFRNGTVQVMSDTSLPSALASDPAPSTTLTVNSTVLSIQTGPTGDGYQDGPFSPDGLLARADVDKNMYVDATEFFRLGIPTQFPQLDRNDDQKIDREELAVLSRVFAAYQTSGARLDVRPFEDPLFAAIDANQNQVLESREIEMAPVRLLQADANRDGNISTMELPAILTMQLSSRTPYEQVGVNAFQPTVTTSVAESTRKLPAWFQQMDLNQDREIEFREFLGAEREFVRLDSNGDGFIEASEITE